MTGEVSQRPIDAFFSHGLLKGQEPFDIPPEQREVFYNLVMRNFFPQVKELAATVAKKGDAFPLLGEKRFYRIKYSRGSRVGSDYLSVGISSLIESVPVKVGDNVVGNKEVTLSVTDGNLPISFHLLDNGKVVVVNDNMDGSERLLDSPEALFEEIPSLKMFPAGKAATWIAKLVQNGLLDKMKSKLAAMEDKR